MFSACIIVGESVEGLGATLGALVPAIADGILRDAVIVDFSSDPDVERVCDAAGCDRIAADIPGTQFLGNGLGKSYKPSL